MGGVEHVGFKFALMQTEARRRHLLLGNGFSIGVHRAFGYSSLHADAVARDPELAELFEPGECNFETALKRCGEDADAARRLREGLIRAVAAVHPEHSLSLSEEQCLSCRDFLEPFVGRSRNPMGTLFTTNYDMLLHWVLSRQGKNQGTRQRSQLKCWDGFAANGEWNSNGPEACNAFYLHGAVHIFERPQPRFPERTYTRMLRYEWGFPLTKQIDAELRAGRLPVFVAAGNSQMKKARQREREYLASTKRKFRTVCRKDQGGVLFTFGHSFGESDEHIAEEVAGGVVRDVFIGTFSASDRERARELAARWSEARSASGGPPITVRSFDSPACQVWDRRRAEFA